MAGLLAGHLRAGELAQLGIDEREQFLPGPGIAVLGGFEKTGDFAHGGSLRLKLWRMRAPKEGRFDSALWLSAAPRGSQP